MQPAERRACAQILAAGSRSFALAARVLPARLRGPAAAVYAFCRQADDAVDTSAAVHQALEGLTRRLDRIYAGTVPAGAVVDQALAGVVRAHALPRSLFGALLEGFLWDAEMRRYETLEDVLAYAARVAGSVGVLMALLMGQRDPAVLARAADLGVAMQLTNIARDVGEDARGGRLYLPRRWLRDVDLRAESFLHAPRDTPATKVLVARLLEAAAPLYARGQAGIAYLPRDCRVAVRAAALIYAEIGQKLRAQGCDSITQRAVVSTPRKIFLLLRACAAVLLRPRPLPDPALPQTAFLLAAADGGRRAA